MFCSCAIPPLLASVLVRANAYLRAPVTLRLSGTVLTNKHNSRTAKATDLISSLINVALSWDVPFNHLQQLQYLHHCATYVPLWSPTLSSQPHKVTICGRHNVMASVQDIQIADALLTLCPAYYVMKQFHIAEIEALWLSCIEIWGTCFKSILSVFSVMAG